MKIFGRKSNIFEQRGESLPSLDHELNSKEINITLTSPTVENSAYNEKYIEEIYEDQSPTNEFALLQIKNDEIEIKQEKYPSSEIKILDEKLQEIKVKVFNDLLEAVDLSQLAALGHIEVREEISDVVGEIIGIYR